MKQKTREIYIEKKSEDTESVEYEAVFINGRAYHVRKGEDVAVPVAVADIISETRNIEKQINKRPNLNFDN